jgi:hypothetical protein
MTIEGQFYITIYTVLIGTMILALMHPIGI